ncbi:DoxX family protein [Subtercola sp. PAMC28395]|uniref:DoxX family protein n=1 Tax=Subtercola sp. PAMC28395 TaxID=2846775 RepID=UPI001C0E8A1F|nr:DoxX family membrane protein [Subtercola sp. PAMC28395]QWT25090.1 DoxX family protein [Subtercola sp. PAMC28395]
MNPETVTAVKLGAAIVLGIVFVVMGINHFLPSGRRTMAAMIPPSMRRAGILSPSNLVLFTGLCEIAGGVGLFLPATRPIAAVALAVFLVAVFPANAYAAAHKDRFGALAIPLVPRAIAQVVLIAILLFVAFG